MTGNFFAWAVSGGEGLELDVLSLCFIGIMLNRTGSALDGPMVGSSKSLRLLGLSLVHKRTGETSEKRINQRCD